MALRAARAGAEVLRGIGLSSPGSAAETKGAGDYVTAADRGSEAAILEVLARDSPGVPVLAEERGGISSDTMWAVDPLDGTTNFTRGFPAISVSVGLVEHGKPVVGVVLAPFLNLEFSASAGDGAFLNGERLSTLGPFVVSRAVVATGFPFRMKQRMPRYVHVMEGALKRFEDLRRVGSAALDLSWTASGTFNGFFELGLNAWDLAAGAALVLEVGGRVTDWSGGGTWLTRGDIVAGPPAVHEVLLELAASAPQG